MCLSLDFILQIWKQTVGLRSSHGNHLTCDDYSNDSELHQNRGTILFFSFYAKSYHVPRLLVDNANPGTVRSRCCLFLIATPPKSFRPRPPCRGRSKRSKAELLDKLEAASSVRTPWQLPCFYVRVVGRSRSGLGAKVAGV